MAFTHTHTRNFSNGASTVTSSISYSGSSEVNIDETIAIGTDTQVNFPVDVSELVSLYMMADEDCTIEVNSGSSPTKTITLEADEAYVWPAGGNTSPLGASDVTALYVTNAAEVNLYVRALVDATP